jgi:serine O-acetyltransferase
MTAVDLQRLGHWFHRNRLSLAAELVRRLTRLVYHAVLPPEVEIGPGTEFAYGGLGVVLHPQCRIGAGVLISHEVTIGGRANVVGAPIIEDGCVLCAGAKILGPIRVGERAVVGANAVVLHDVPARTVVAGIPARVLRRDIQIEEYRGREEALAAADVPRRFALVR